LKSNPKLYYDSKIEAKLSSGRTHSEAFVANVLGKKIFTNSYQQCETT